MHQTDLLRRRQVMAQMPAQIFQPLHKRQEMREDWQRDMEFAFEDMYTGERSKEGVIQIIIHFSLFSLQQCFSTLAPMTTFVAIAMVHR